MRATCVSLDGRDRRTFTGAAKVGKGGEVSFSAPWKDPQVWDLDATGNRYACRVALLRDGKVVDETVPFVFAFREVRIDGRDLRLNGRKVHLRALCDRLQDWNPHLAAHTNAFAWFEAAKTHGFNAMIAGNYHFGAGATPAVEDMLRAADETGFMYCFTLPHFKDFDSLDQPEGRAAYREATRRAMRLARRHPSVVLWATSHNAAGYLGAGHPQRIDGKYELPESCNGDNRRRARICREVIRELDPSRPCYHHESGNLDDFHCVNCYLDWASVQERSDWLAHWATEGVKPLFFVEWGLPHISTWSSYRGPNFIWRTQGFMSIWAAEYAAAFRNDAAYAPDKAMKSALAREQALWRESPRGFGWWMLGSACTQMTENYLGVQALYASDNWRSMRAWGITAVLPWDQDGLFRLVGTKSVPCPLSDARKRPGVSAERICAAWGSPEAYAPTPLGKVFHRWNQPDCAWIGGAGVFTDKRHVFAPGATVEKQLVILNDRRRKQRIAWRATLEGQGLEGAVEVEPGEKALVPVSLAAPDRPGKYGIRAAFTFAGGVVQTDEFALDVVAPKASAADAVPVLVDAVGKTREGLKRLKIPFKEGAAPAPDERLVVGRGSLTKDLLNGTVLPHVRRGGRVIVFEQTKGVLEEIGFRTQVYGLRRVFPRFRDAAYADVLQERLLRDWNGESTLERAYTPPSAVENGSDGDTFAGYWGARVWRNGFRGAVASVLPEKPSYGDWVPWIDGGFDLQYSPLLEWRLGSGSVVFCQMDVTARSAPELAADELVKALCAGPLPTPGRERGKAAAYGMLAYAATVYSPRRDAAVEQDHDRTDLPLYLVTSGAGAPPADFAERIRSGACALLLGLDGKEISDWSPVPLRTEYRREQMHSRIEKLPPELNGLSNADWAWHGLMDFTAFADADEGGNAAVKVVRCGKGTLVFWQVPPWAINAELRPYMRSSKRRAEFMLSRLMSNLGFRKGDESIRYADVPVAEDDPYRYYHW